MKDIIRDASLDADRRLGILEVRHPVSPLKSEIM